MRYIIETTEYGCIETLEFSGGKFTKRTERNGYKSLDSEIVEQVEEAGFDEEILYKVDELCSIYAGIEFLQLAKVEQGEL